MSRGSFALVALFLLGATTRLEAQVLRGQLIDLDKIPIAVATVALRDKEGTLVAQTLTNSEGHFLVAAPEPGTYIVEAGRIGYQVWSQSFDLKAGDTLDVQVTLIERATARVAPIVVTGGARGRDEWKERKELGVGVFLTGDEIRAQKTFTVLEALRVVPGLTVVDQAVPGLQTVPALRTSMGDHCLVYFVNGQQLQVNPEVPYEYTLNLMVGPNQVAGVEVYREYKEVPRQFRLKIESRAMLDQTSATSRPIGLGVPAHTPVSQPRTCGMVLVWTGRAW